MPEQINANTRKALKLYASLIVRDNEDFQIPEEFQHGPMATMLQKYIDESDYTGGWNTKPIYLTWISAAINELRPLEGKGVKRVISELEKQLKLSGKKIHQSTDRGQTSPGKESPDNQDNKLEYRLH